MTYTRNVLLSCTRGLLILAILLTGCSASTPEPAPAAAAATLPAAETSAPIVTEAPAATAITPQPVTYYLPDYLPAALRAGIQLPSDWSAAADPTGAALSLEVDPSGSSSSISHWVFAAAAPFPTIADAIKSEDLKSAWLGKIPQGFLPESILVSPSTAQIFTALWGQPDASIVATVPEADLLDRAWAGKAVLALIPFEQIEPKWKILDIDGQNPLHKGFDLSTYALTVPFAMRKHNDVDLSGAIIPSSNRDPNKLTTVLLTGVTALVRGTADLMERNGMEYPAQDIGDVLREADILYVNNEIPFTYKCPPPFMREDNLVFCSKPEYIDLLDAIGTDVVELAGDHFQDWGPEAVLESIDLYNAHHMKYYGGGLNLQDGRKALQMEVNGNKIAFIGCNAKPPGYAGARENQPGAVHCDFDWLKQEIARVKAEGYIPISTFQHLEYYSYNSHPILKADFEAVASDGALIASGSQAHQPQAMEFFNGSFLHFGLGNLFFDQYKEGIPERQAFMDRHVIYDNKYINTELLTIQFVDLARARLMTPTERQDLLRIVFNASGFNAGW
jgi:hypothetical protein